MPQLLDEIMEQPQVLHRLLDLEYPRICETIVASLRPYEIHSVLIAARGTSDNAATYAKYLLGALNRLPVALAAPSLYTLYGAPPLLHHTLVVGISQSGMSPDIVAVLEHAHQQGMPTLAITNTPGSRLAQVADFVIDCRSGQEHSVAATKTYTAELMALALLAVALAGDQARLQALRGVPSLVEETLRAHVPVLQERAQRYRYMDDCVVIGRGYNYATANEIALKLKELTYCSANPYSAADFMHGPIAVVGEGFPVLLAAPSGQVFPDLWHLAQELAWRRAELLVISDCAEMLELAQTALPLPGPQGGIEEWLSPLVAVVPGQLLAYYLALAKGLDPEHPRGLHKVTETR